MPTTNALLAYLISAQAQPEVSLNGDLDIIDDLFFIRRGTLAARPAAARAGRLYIATDAGNEGLTRDNGSSWDAMLGQGGTHLNFSGGTAPTGVGAANNGSSPPAVVFDAGSNDTRGGLTFGTGTGATAGAQVTVTFASSYSGVVVVMIVARNAATANLGLYISAALGSFTINSANVPAGAPTGQANTTFSAKWLAVG